MLIGLFKDMGITGFKVIEGKNEEAPNELK
jgi:hypothetical protein